MVHKQTERWNHSVQRCMKKGAASSGVCGLYSSQAGWAAAPAVAVVKRKN